MNSSVNISNVAIDSTKDIANETAGYYGTYITGPCKDNSPDLPYFDSTPTSQTCTKVVCSGLPGTLEWSASGFKFATLTPTDGVGPYNCSGAIASSLDSGTSATVNNTAATATSGSATITCSDPGPASASHSGSLSASAISCVPPLLCPPTAAALSWADGALGPGPCKGSLPESTVGNKLTSTNTVADLTGTAEYTCGTEGNWYQQANQAKNNSCVSAPTLNNCPAVPVCRIYESPIRSTKWFQLLETAAGTTVYQEGLRMEDNNYNTGGFYQESVGRNCTCSTNGTWACEVLLIDGSTILEPFPPVDCNVVPTAVTTTTTTNGPACYVRVKTLNPGCGKLGVYSTLAACQAVGTGGIISCVDDSTAGDLGCAGGCGAVAAAPAPSTYGTCFIAGTQVTMKDHQLKSIEDVRVGEEIATYDENTGLQTVSPVEKVFHHKEQLSILYTFSFESSTVTSNDLHLFFLPKENRYLSAQQIYQRWVRGENFELLDENQGLVRVTSIEQSVKRVSLYNLHVKSSYDGRSHLPEGMSPAGHNYYANGVLVHNVKWGGCKSGCTAYCDAASTCADKFDLSYTMVNTIVVSFSTQAEKDAFLSCYASKNAECPAPKEP